MDDAPKKHVEKQKQGRPKVKYETITQWKLEWAWEVFWCYSPSEFLAWVRTNKFPNSKYILNLRIDTLREYVKLGIPEKKLNNFVLLFKANRDIWVSSIEKTAFQDAIREAWGLDLLYSDSSEGQEAEFVEQNIQDSYEQQSGSSQANHSRFQIREIPSINPYFTGRKDILTKLDKELFLLHEEAPFQRKIAVLSGLGGIGKTQVARAYVNKNLKDTEKFPLMFWFEAGSKGEINTGYRNLGEALGIYSKGKKDDIIREQVFRHLEQPENSGWLLIYNDVSNIKEFFRLIPRRGGSILVTTRHRHWERIKPIEVQKFTRTSSQQLLHQICDRLDDAEGANKLADTLGDFPLALTQAGSFIRHQLRHDFHTYRKIFLEARKTLWKQENAPEDYDETISTTWRISRAAIAEELPEAEKLLQIISFLHWNKIPCFLLEIWIRETKGLKDFELELELDARLTKLAEYSMIDVGVENISIHSLVQTVVRDSLSEDDKQKHLLVLLDIFHQELLFYYENTNNLNEEKKLILHVEKFLNHLRLFDELYRTKNVAYLLSVLGHYLNYFKTELMRSFYLLSSAVDILEEIFGKNSLEVSIIYNNIGSALYAQGKFPEALAHFQNSLRITKKTLGENHVGVSIICNYIGSVLHAQGKFPEALVHHQNALRITKEKLGENHAKVAITYSKIGSVLHAQGKFSEALAHHRNALRITKETLGENHVDMSTVYSEIGLSLLWQGNFSEALAHHQNALRITKEKLGENHVKVAAIYNNIGSVLHAQENFSEALAHFQNALRIKKEKLGENHVDVATIYNNIGFILQEQGKFPKALTYHQSALRICKEKLGENHVKVATIYNNIGLVLHAQEKFPEALECHQNAFRIKKETLGENHVDVAITCCHIAITYKHMNKGV